MQLSDISGRNKNIIAFNLRERFHLEECLACFTATMYKAIPYFLGYSYKTIVPNFPCERFSDGRRHLRAKIPLSYTQRRITTYIHDVYY